MNVPLQPDESKLTAYALGELRGADWAEVEQWLAENPTHRKAVDEIADTARILEKQLKQPEAAPVAMQLTDAQRARIEQHIIGHVRVPYRRLGRMGERTSGPPYIAYAAAASVIGIVLIWAVITGWKPSRTASTQTPPATRPTSRAPILIAANPTDAPVVWAGEGDATRDGFASVRDDQPIYIPFLRQRASFIELNNKLDAGMHPEELNIHAGELVNALDFHTPLAVPGKIALAMDMAESPWNPSRRFVRVSVRPPSDMPDGSTGSLALKVSFDPRIVDAYRVYGLTLHPSPVTPSKTEIPAEARCYTAIIELVLSGDKSTDPANVASMIKARVEWLTTGQPMQVVEAKIIHPTPTSLIPKDMQFALAAINLEASLTQPSSHPIPTPDPTAPVNAPDFLALMRKIRKVSTVGVEPTTLRLKVAHHSQETTEKPHISKTPTHIPTRSEQPDLIRAINAIQSLPLADDEKAAMVRKLLSA